MNKQLETDDDHQVYVSLLIVFDNAENVYQEVYNQHHKAKHLGLSPPNVLISLLDNPWAKPILLKYDCEKLQWVKDQVK